MTSIELCYYTPDELEKIQSSIWSEEEKNRAFTVDHYDPATGWLFWKSIQNLYPSNEFIFFERFSKEFPKISTLYFINIVQAALALEEHYDFFSRLTQYDYDPLTVIHKISDEDNEFWQRVFNEPALLGILYGYGKNNSVLFSWKKELKTQAITIHSEFKRKVPFGSAKIKNFSLPTFASFFEGDPQITLYEKQRREIIKQYKNQDFVELTLKRMTSQIRSTPVKPALH